MKRLHFCRSGRVVSVLANNKIRRAAPGVEILENRRLLSAVVISQIPTQNLTGGQAAPGIALNTYLDDPAITGGTVVEMQTPLGNIPLQLTNAQTPLTVANFMTYINNGEYTPTIFQRLAAGFVLQGGGTKPNGSNNAPVTSLQGEPGISNTLGTIAMALSSGPNSGTNQWFINLGNNASSLDGTADGGPFTVFGNVIDGGMTIANAISQLPIINGSAENSNWYIGSNDGLPVINYTGVFAPTTVPQANLVTDNIVVVPPSQAAPTYTAMSANTALVTASVTNGVLTLTPASPTASGTTTVTATVRDLGGGTASSTFTVNVSGEPAISTSNAIGTVGTGNQVVFPISLSTANTSATTFNYSLTAGTAPSGDFQATGSSITIPAGSTQADIPVNIIGDSTGGSETFTLTLSSLSGNAVFSNENSTLTATGTIKPMAETTTTVSASSSSVAFGGTETLTANVTPAVTGAAVSGTVSFSVGGTLVGTAAVTADSASLAINLNTTGSQSITATYNGDSLNPASTSDPITVVVADPSTLVPTLAKAVVPGNAIAGQPFKGSISLTLTNNDQIAPQSGRVTVNLYATTNGIVTPDSVLVASIARTATIKSGKPVTLAVPIKSMPSTVAAGICTLVAQAVDATGVLTTLVIGPTVAVAAPTIVLTESFTKLPLPVSVVAGAKASTVAVVKIINRGNILSAGNTTISLYASSDGTVAGGTLIKTVVRKLSIKPGKSITASIPFGAYPMVSDGNYSIVAQVIDPKAQASSITSSSTVKIAAAFVDLAAVALMAPATATPGKSISITVSITNVGNSIAKGMLVDFFGMSLVTDGTGVTSLSTQDTNIKLQPGGKQIIRLKVLIPAGTAPGNEYLLASLDVRNTFGDTNLTNNYANRALRIIG